MQLKPLNASIWRVLGGGAFGIGLLAAAPMAAADLQVLEVQPIPIDAPEQLIIWGTDFDNPMVKFGTYPHALAYSADQSLCPGTPAPPLDNSAVDCIVVDLPVGAADPPFDNPDPGSVPAGDYLLSLWQETAPECAEKPNYLTFLYQPFDCSGENSQPESSCSGDLTGTAGPASLSAPDANQVSWVFNPNPVGNGGLVTLTGSGGNGWPNNLDLTIEANGFIQNVELHTSCSQPLAIGDVYGSMTLVDIGAELTPGMEHALYDLTLGAIGPEGPEGPQGPQGKQGDQGDQGPQGKQGDAGDQGPQGKQGDQGDQGPQGKQGDQGDQGPQGKQGDTGDQGPQGKQGDTGAQGPQGKVGDTGAQGPQGKVGDTGAQGPQGKQGDTGAQGPQGKQGDTGAQGPQGKVGDQGPQGKQGDTGAQGPQGKQGDTGAQGPQGKQGDTGAQGPQGKQGDTGAQGPQGKSGAQGPQGKQGDAGPMGPQGPQGKQGPAGEDGADGIGSNLLCFATDQTIGTGGKYMGIGQQAGKHSDVSVVVPFSSGDVMSLVVKATQGNNPVSGVARLIHDATPFTGFGEQLGDDCVLSATANKTICFVNISDGELNALDSLSVHIQTNSGSFPGASACVLISDPVPQTGPPGALAVLPEGRLD